MYKIYVDGKTFCSSEIDELALINPVITTEVNKAGSFNFTIPPDHPYRSLIKPLQSMIAVHFIDGDTEDIVFFGICNTIKENIYGERVVSCEGALTLANRRYSSAQVYKLNVYPVKTIFEANANNWSYVGTNYISLTPNTCDVTNSKGATTIAGEDPVATKYEMLMKMIDVLGGYLQIDNITYSLLSDRMSYYAKINYLTELPSECNQSLTLGENVITMDVDIDEPELFTVVYPVGAKYTTSSGWTARYLGTKTSITSLVNKYGTIEKKVVFEDETTNGVLTALGKQYIQDNLFRTKLVKATFLDLHYTNPAYDRIKPGHKVKVVSSIHGINEEMKVISRTYNLDAPQKDVVTLGSTESYDVTTA